MTSSKVRSRLAVRAGAVKAPLHEWLIYAVSHPLPLLLAEVTRRLGPVVRVPRVGYVISDPLVAREILTHDEAFDKQGRGSMGAVITQVMGEYALLNMDGEAHRKLRRQLTDLFSPAYLDTVAREVLEPAAAGLREALEEGATVDLVPFMHALSGRITCHMLGIDAAGVDDERRYREIYELGADLISVLRITTTHLSPAQERAARARYEQLAGYAREAYEHPESRPHSVIARLRELGLTFDEAKGVIAVLMVVATETVSTAVPRIVALLADSGELARLRARPELLSGAVDEGLRYVVPSPIMTRSVTRPIAVQGHRFPEGARVLIFTYNFLKHPRYYPHPRRFDITRRHDPEVRHLWFGAGPHFCLGFGLAQREIRSLLQVLLDLPAEVRVTRRRYTRGVMIPAYRSLQIRLAP